MGFPANYPALWSLIGIVVSLVMSVVCLLFLWFCYFPGGYKKKEVMDIGEYAMFIAQTKVEERRKKLEKTEEEDYVNQYDELYHEMDPGADEEEPYYGEEEYSKREGSDWQSVGTSDQHDIEGGEYYDGTSSSSPSSRSYSQSAQTYDHQSSISPSSQATPSQASTLKPALKSTRDDQSESIYTPGSGAGSGSGSGSGSSSYRG